MGLRTDSWNVSHHDPAQGVCETKASSVTTLSAGTSRVRQVNILKYEINAIFQQFTNADSRLKLGLHRGTRQVASTRHALSYPRASDLCAHKRPEFCFKCLTQATVLVRCTAYKLDVCIWMSYTRMECIPVQISMLRAPAARLNPCENPPMTGSGSLADLGRKCSTSSVLSASALHPARVGERDPTQTTASLYPSY